MVRQEFSAACHFRLSAASKTSTRSTRPKGPISSRGENRFARDSPLEGAGFEPVWGFSCQVVFFGLLAVLCSERESRSSSRRLRSGSRSARKGSRDRNASKAWRGTVKLAEKQVW